MKAKLAIIFTCIVAFLFFLLSFFTPIDPVIIQAKSFKEAQISSNNPKLFFEHTGHFYQLFDDSLEFHDAKNFCIERGGHLVTIQSAEENAFILDLLGYGWLGATDEVAEGEWLWVTGEPFTYANWAPEEPNNYNNEDYCIIATSGWNDVPVAPNPFVCEFLHHIHFVNLIGDVLLNETQALTDDFIQPGDIVTVDENSFASIEIHLGNIVKELDVGPNTKILITNESIVSDVTIEFFMGKLRGIVDELPEDYNFEIWTPLAVIGVRGTEWIIEGDENQTTVTVLDSSVEVSTRDDPDETVVVATNQQLQVTSEGLGEPDEIDPDTIDDWWNVNEYFYYFSLITR